MKAGWYTEQAMKDELTYDPSLELSQEWCYRHVLLVAGMIPVTFANFCMPRKLIANIIAFTTRTPAAKAKLTRTVEYPLQQTLKVYYSSCNKFKYDPSKLQYSVEFEWTGSLLEQMSGKNRQVVTTHQAELAMSTHIDDGEDPNGAADVMAEASLALYSWESLQGCS